MELEICNDINNYVIMWIVNITLMLSQSKPILYWWNFRIKVVKY